MYFNSNPALKSTKYYEQQNTSHQTARETDINSLGRDDANYRIEYSVSADLSRICKGPVHIGLLRVSDEIIHIVAQRGRFSNGSVRLFGVIPD